MKMRKTWMEKLANAKDLPRVIKLVGGVAEQRKRLAAEGYHFTQGGSNIRAADFETALFRHA